jgi:hypothetical protein
MMDATSKMMKQKVRWMVYRIAKLNIYICDSDIGHTLSLSLSLSCDKELGPTRWVKSPALRHRIFKFSKSKKIGSTVKNE